MHVRGGGGGPAAAPITCMAIELNCLSQMVADPHMILLMMMRLWLASHNLVRRAVSPPQNKLAVEATTTVVVVAWVVNTRSQLHNMQKLLRICRSMCYCGCGLRRYHSKDHKW